MFEYSLRRLLSIFDVRSLVKLVSAVLLELQIIIQSSGLVVILYLLSLPIHNNVSKMVIEVHDQNEQYHVQTQSC